MNEMMLSSVAATCCQETEMAIMNKQTITVKDVIDRTMIDPTVLRTSTFNSLPFLNGRLFCRGYILSPLPRGVE